MKKLTNRLFEKDGVLYREIRLETPWKVYKAYIKEFGWQPIKKKGESDGQF